MTTVTLEALYLSRLHLNPRSRRVMRELGQPYEMHRTLMRAFPEAAEGTNAREEFGVLFRPELDGRRGSVQVYVQSLVEPNWSFVETLDDYLSPETPGFELKDILPAYLRIREGQTLSFRLRANPTKRIARRNDPMRGKRVELRSQDEQIDWLIRKGHGSGSLSAGGFELLGDDYAGQQKELHNFRVRAYEEGKQVGRKTDGTTRLKTTHYAVLFEGLLRVIDSEDLLRSISRGIGPAKAYGFGLLSVGPVST